MRLAYKIGEESNIKEYVDMSYLSDPHQGKYYFLTQGATISWNLTKQRLASSTHSKTIALHEASCEREAIL
jgi:hypothetical protein